MPFHFTFGTSRSLASSVREAKSEGFLFGLAFAKSKGLKLSSSSLAEIAQVSTDMKRGSV